MKQRNEEAKVIITKYFESKGKVLDEKKWETVVENERKKVVKFLLQLNMTSFLVLF